MKAKRENLDYLIEVINGNWNRNFKLYKNGYGYSLMEGKKDVSNYTGLTSGEMEMLLEGIYYVLNSK